MTIKSFKKENIVVRGTGKQRTLMIIGGKRMNLVGDKIYLRNIEDEDINVLKL